MKPFVCLATLLSLSACDSDNGCRNTVVSTAMAPGGRHSAAMFARDCGATTGFTTQVSVLGVAEQPTNAGNVFVADHGGTPTAWGGPWAEIAWLAPDRLLVRYDSSVRIFKKVGRINGVTVSYQPVAR